MSEHHGKIWWNEHTSSNPKMAAEQWAAMAGWTIQNSPMTDMEYYIAMREDMPVAGFMKLDDIPGDRQIPPHWFTYIAVSDVAATVADNESAGGTTMRPPFDVPGVGRMAVICDVTGATVGVMTPA